jgi:hypothetical protein
VQCKAVQCSAVQCSAVQCSAGWASGNLEIFNAQLGTGNIRKFYTNFRETSLIMWNSKCNFANANTSPIHKESHHGRGAGREVRGIVGMPEPAIGLNGAAYCSDAGHRHRVDIEITARRCTGHLGRHFLATRMWDNCWRTSGSNSLNPDICQKKYSVECHHSD